MSTSTNKRKRSDDASPDDTPKKAKYTQVQAMLDEEADDFANYLFNTIFHRPMLNPHGSQSDESIALERSIRQAMDEWDKKESFQELKIVPRIVHIRPEPESDGTVSIKVLTFGMIPHAFMDFLRQHSGSDISAYQIMWNAAALSNDDESTILALGKDDLDSMGKTCVHTSGGCIYDWVQKKLKGNCCSSYAYLYAIGFCHVWEDWVTSNNTYKKSYNSHDQEAISHRLKPYV